MLVCEIFFKLKFSKFLQNIRTLIVFGKFLLIVWGKIIQVAAYNGARTINDLVNIFCMYDPSVYLMLYSNRIEEMPENITV